MGANYILHLPKWFPNKTDNLEGIFTERHIRCTQNYQKNLVLYLKSTELRQSNQWHETEWTVEDGLEILRVYYRKRCSSIGWMDKVYKFLLFFYLTRVCLNHIFKKYGKPDLIVVHVLLRHAIVAYFLKLFHKIPYIVIEHSTFYLQSEFSALEKLKNRIRSIVVQKADVLIGVSKQLLAAMKKLGIGNADSIQVYNSVNTKIFNPASQKDHADFVFLHVSEFNNDHKNITGILEAMAMAVNTRPELQLHLVGYGKDQELILGKINELGLTQNVRYLGKLETRELAGVFQQADAFVLFSNKENMPCVLAESLCCGTPVIASRVGGISEIISRSNGCLVEKGDIPALTAAMLKLATGSCNFNRAQISSEAMQLFSEQSVGEKLNSIYNRLYRHLVK
ncbi:MAG: glycosyltransferase [Saprospiraceae bacterium]|nr:glycosyltransferase [Saprospiraceae bacterium]